MNSNFRAKKNTISWVIAVAVFSSALGFVVSQDNIGKNIPDSDRNSPYVGKYESGKQGEEAESDEPSTSDDSAAASDLKTQPQNIVQQKTSSPSTSSNSSNTNVQNSSSPAPVKTTTTKAS
jgi:hypothetical protein